MANCSALKRCQYVVRPSCTTVATWLSGTLRFEKAMKSPLARFSSRPRLINSIPIEWLLRFCSSSKLDRPACHAARSVDTS